jgi:hypothetical protein
MAGEQVAMSSQRETIDNVRIALNALRLEFDTVEGELDDLRDEFDIVEGELDAEVIARVALEAEHDLLAAAPTTSETDTGRKAYGGATIYQKAFAVANFPNATTANVAHGVTTPNLVRVYGVADNGTNQYQLHTEDGVGMLSAMVDDTNIVLSAAANLSGYSGYVVMEYTKP